MVPFITFDREQLSIPAGTEVTIVADNIDTGLSHNFAVYASREVAESEGQSAALAMTEECKGPCTRQLTLNLDTGEYFFRCEVHPPIMTGTLIVQ